MVDAPEREEYHFQAEIRQVLDLLIHSLYQHRDIFLRELISNASDALNKVRIRELQDKKVHDPKAPMEIRVSVDAEAKTITVSDRGIGLTKAEMVSSIGTIANSGTRRVLEKLKDKPDDMDIIGQFGVGFYSIFMVADRVEVISRSAGGQKAHIWTSTGTDSYTIEPTTRKERGTDIILHLKPDAEEFADEYRIKALVKKYSNYIAYPILVGDEQANDLQAIWRRKKKDITQEEHNEFYRAVSGHWDEPLLSIMAQSEAPVQFYALLYVPKQQDRTLFRSPTDYGLKLYSRKVLIEDQNQELLPTWMRFLRGVVDSEDLPLNVSRETVQASGVVQKISKALVSKVLREFKRISEKEPELYAELWGEWGNLIKEGVPGDPPNRDKILPLLRFKSNKRDLISLDEYVADMKPDQEAILYLAGDDPEALARSPHLEWYRKQDQEVLFMTDTIDPFVTTNLGEYREKRLKIIDEASGEDIEVTGEIQQLIDRMQALLGDKVSDIKVSDRLASYPSRLVTPAGGMSTDMDRMFKLMNESGERGPPRKVLEINVDHALIEGMIRMVQKDPEGELLGDLIEQVYDNGLLLDGIHPDPSAVVERVNRLMGRLVSDPE